MIITPNTVAPDFTLPDQDGKVHSLVGYRGKWVLLYFYPKDYTTGGTKEACAIRDAHAAHLGPALIRQAITDGRRTGHLTLDDADRLEHELLGMKPRAKKGRPVARRRGAA